MPILTNHHKRLCARDLLIAARCCLRQYFCRLNVQKPTLEACVDAAGARHGAFGDCSSFQFAQKFALWGCFCCGQTSQPRKSDSGWSVYAFMATPPPLPSGRSSRRSNIDGPSSCIWGWPRWAPPLGTCGSGCVPVPCGSWSPAAAPGRHTQRFVDAQVLSSEKRPPDRTRGL